METELPAIKVIRLFGSVEAVARAVGLSTVQIHRWTYPKTKGGHDGYVPSRHHERLLNEARAQDLPLTLVDLAPHLADHMGAHEPHELA